MIILHIGYCDGRLYLWGENIESSLSPKQAGVFGATLQDISKAVRGTKLKLNDTTITAWLPTNKFGPIPSTTTQTDDKIEISPWQITAIPLSTTEAINILSACMGKVTLRRDVVIGADIKYWVDVLKLTSFQVVRQQYLPDLIDTGDSYAAVWSMTYSDDLHQQIQDLQNQMPLVARALTVSGQSMPSSRPADILKRIVATMLDYIVRVAASGKNTPRRNIRKQFRSPHDMWVYALKTLGDSNPELYNIQNFAVDVRSWRPPLDVQFHSDFRLCFRLEEPTDDSDWRVTFLLQNKDDPSLMITPDQLWMNDGMSGLNLDELKEFLILSLSRTAKISSSIRDGLDQNDITGYMTNMDDAFKFLNDDAETLRDAGYGVLLPSWWNRKGSKPRIVGQTEKGFNSSTGMLTLGTIVSFDWEVALGDQKVTLQELEDLANIKEPLVRVRGRWVAVNNSEIKSAAKFLKTRPKRMTFRDVIKTTLGMADLPQELEFGGVQTTGYMADVLQKIKGQAEFEELEQPEGFTGTLRPYQVRGYSWLVFLSQWGLGGCLADDMGLGKTLQMLALIQHDWPKSQRPTLLVCPTSVMNNWQREAARFTPDLPVMIHHGSDRLKSHKFSDAAQRHAIIITSYGLLQRDLDRLSSIDWQGAVLDEAQNIKNPETKQSKAVRSLTAEYKFTLTGTPVENHLGDLWSIMDFLNPGFLGTRGQFQRNYLTPVQERQDYKVADRLKQATGPFILRRVKTDKSIISDLPEKMEMNVLCPLTKEQASLYASIIKDTERAIVSSEGIQRKGIILSTLTRLKQVCNHPAHFLGDNSSIGDRSGKMARLIVMLEEVISAGERALVFTQYAEMGKMLQSHLKKIFNVDVPFLYGAVPKSKRDIMVDNFQEGDGPSIFILSLKAGGTGLNLTAANHVFHFDRWWNPAVENQATDRAFRIGQERSVHVHKMICVGTLEERINDMIEAKKLVADKVVGTGEGWLTEMSNKDLREIISLSREAAII